jgi:queuosine precursor transporter
MTVSGSEIAPAARPASALGRDGFRYFDFMMAAFVAILLLSNVIGAAKPSVTDFRPLLLAVGLQEGAGGIGHWLFDHSILVYGAGILFFPLSYLLGDILTEVYGYGRARRCVWAGFVALIFLAFMSSVVVALPPAPGWQGQAAYESVFGQVGRIVLASILAFWAGELVNSYVMARMKVMTKGRYLFARTWASTIVGQGVDSVIFYPVAFLGVWDSTTVIAVMTVNWALKVGWEILLTPVTYAVVGFLKRAEGVDIFDDGTDFTPFRTAL